MTISEITNTKQMDFSFEAQGFGAVAIAAKRISNGETVSFAVFNRQDKNDSTSLTYKGKFYFGLCDLGEDKGIAFRMSFNSDLDSSGSNSLIASWYGDTSKDAVYIAARLQMFLMREGSDYFIDTPKIL